MTKRIFDVVLSLLIISLSFWLLFVFWLIAVVDTCTNGIFIQERIGQFGKKFKIYKLRTMQISPSDEKRVSRIAKILRRYKLDEFPQLFNVLAGDMSLVGPRPDLPGYYDLLEGENRKILELKPGLTSHAALKYFDEEKLLQQQKDPLSFNNRIIFPDKVQMNLDYYYNRNFWGDVKIIMNSFGSIFSR